MPVSQKPRKQRTDQYGQLKNLKTHNRGPKPFPYKWVWVFKRNSKGQLQYRSGKLLIDWKKSGWIVDPKWGNNPQNKKGNVENRFDVPTKNPKNRDTPVKYLDYCSDDDYYRITGKYRKSDSRFVDDRIVKAKKYLKKLVGA